MGDEVPDEGANDAPDEEPPARAEGDPTDEPEGTETDADPRTGDAGGAEGGPGTEADTREETAEETGALDDAEVTGDTGGTEDPGGADDTDPAGSPDAGSGDPGEDDPSEYSPVLSSFDEVSGDDDGGNDEGTEADDDDGAEGTEADDDGDGGIPDDYDPFQPSVDLDRDAHQYPSPADDTAGSDDGADDASESGSDDEADSLDAGADPDPEAVTEEWTADESVPQADVGETSAAKSDGGYADGTGTTSVGEYEAPVGDEELFEGPPDDQEMPLADHIEEMIRRLGIVLIVMAIVSGIVFPFGDRIINFLWYSVLVSNPVPQPRVYHPLALILARLKVATLAGFIIALPVFVYESYQFMKPGLYPHERRYYLASVPTSLVLATVGVLFAYFLVLPALFTYFLYYSDEVTVIAFGLTETFDLMVLMLGGFAFIFQIPLFVMLAIMMGLTTRQWMADRRLYFWGAFLGLAFLFSPDPTGMAPIIVAATMVALFEGTLFLLKWTKRGRRRVPGG
jgi:sec-independent protein translocase protein TatC